MRRAIVHPVRWWHQLNSWLEQKGTLLGAWSSVVAIIGVPLIGLGGYAAWLQISEYLAKPDIAFHLEHAKRVTFSLVNRSPVLLREPGYALSLWNLDARVGGEGDDPGNLLIPTKSLRYIRPWSRVGPWAIETLSTTAREIPDGNVVFGWVSVKCPDCVARRHYWLLFKKSESAWYTEIPPEEQPSITKNLSTVLNSGAGYADAIRAVVPVDRRWRIRDGD